jgi:photosystem II stability/assembly factor-like uncharacterized protein
MDNHRMHISWFTRMGGVLIACALAWGSLGFVRAAGPSDAAPTPGDATFTVQPVGTLTPASYYFPIVLKDGSLNLASHVLIRSGQGFDTCSLPSLNTLKTWWSKSPYRSINIYLGGSSFYKGCSYGGLNSAYMAAADQMGWTFILTWVGPQAPCFAALDPAHLTAISSDSNTAYDQGRKEADGALDKARSLGFSGNILIYYDLEGYASHQVTNCRDVTNRFIAGWVSRLHEQGLTAGVYGGSCSSHVTDWAAISDVPDYLWAACWNFNYVYDRYASVYSLLCLSDQLWNNHKRVRQYTGDHQETYGGASLNEIDSDVIDGAVLAYGYGGLTASANEAPITTQALGPQTRASQLVAPGQGWTLVDGRLWWTDDSGAAWREITPAAVQGNWLGVAFFDPETGWVASQSADGALHVLRTLNGGLTWQDSSPSAAANSATSALDEAFVEFTSPSDGWISVKFQSGASFSLGELYRTTDGGQTWQRFSLPIAGPVRFADAQHGWVSGGAGGGELYTTADGGRTWQPVSFQSGEEPIKFGLPVILDNGTALLPVVRTAPGQVYLEIYSGQAASGVWTLASTSPISPSAAGSGAIALIPAGEGWAAPLADGSLVFYGSDGRQSAQLPAGSLPEGWTQVRFAGADQAWAQTWVGTCSGDKSSADFACTQQAQLLRSQDAGGAWQTITPPG